MMPWKRPIVNSLFICLLVAASLLSACAGQLDIDFSMGGEGESSGGAISQNNLFIVLLVVLFAIFVLVVVAASSRG